VWLPRILKWVVDHVDGISKLKSADRSREFSGNAFDG
jgi:hypothetical protein